MCAKMLLYFLVLNSPFPFPYGILGVVGGQSETGSQLGGGTARSYHLAPIYLHSAASWVPKAASAAAFMSGPTLVLLPFRVETEVARPSRRSAYQLMGGANLQTRL